MKPKPRAEVGFEHRDLKDSELLLEWPHTGRKLMAHVRNNSPEATELADIELMPNDRPAALSYAQDRYWLLSLLEPANAAYNSVRAIRLHGPLDRETMRGAIADVYARHESLRMCVAVQGGKPVLQVKSDLLAPLDWIDRAGHALDKGEIEVAIESVRAKPFELTEAPLARVTVVSDGSQSHLVILVAHRIMVDDSSMERILIDLGRFYSARKSGSVPAVPSLGLQFSDFARWQCAQAHGSGFANLIEYWKERLSGELPVLELGVDFPRPARTTYGGRAVDLTFDSATLSRLDPICAGTESSTFDVILTLLLVVLSKHTGQTDFVVGSPATNRVRSGTSELVGRIATVLPMRFTLPEHCTFRQLLLIVRDERRAALAHQELPFERLLEDLPPVRDMSRHPLFQVLVHEATFSARELEFTALDVALVEREPTAVMFDLEFQFDSAGESPLLRCIYNKALFADARIRALVGHIAQLVLSFDRDLDTPVRQIDVLGEDERQTLLLTRNAATQQLPEVEHLHRLVERQVEQTPDAIALCCGKQEVTFRELNARANQLARHLCEHGAEVGARIGICLERSIDMMVAILAALKAGSTYV
ncbi:MAG TPA: condensation domain-containing protein, partial [Polyangiaceae bacterium]